MHHSLAFALTAWASLLTEAGTEPATSAMSRAGLSPLVLDAKEGLALVNGTHFMAGIGALLAVRAHQLLDTADAAAALSLEALRGAPEAFDGRVPDGGRRAPVLSSGGGLQPPA